MRPRTGAVFPLGFVEFCTTASAREHLATADWQVDCTHLDTGEQTDFHLGLLARNVELLSSFDSSAFLLNR